MARDLLFACLSINLGANKFGPEKRKSLAGALYTRKTYKHYRYAGLIMKQIVWLFAIVLVGVNALPTNAALNLSEPTPSGTKKTVVKNAADGIQFTEASWREILKKAKAEKKVIFLDAYASWCGPCKLLQKNVFTKKAVGDFYNEKFINVKMDMEKGEGPALSQVYPLEVYPTLLFIDGNGRVLKKVLGLQTPENLIAIGKSVK